MRKRLTALVLSLMTMLWWAGCTMWGERKPHVWKDVTGGESLERVFWEQVKNKKWAELEPHLAATYVLVTREGTLDRTTGLEYWKQLEIREYSLGDFNVQPNGNTYVVAYTLSLHGSPLGETLVRDARVCQERQGRLLLPKRAEVQDEVRDVRLQRRGEPRRR